MRPSRGLSVIAMTLGCTSCGLVTGIGELTRVDDADASSDGNAGSDAGGVDASKIDGASGTDGGADGSAGAMVVYAEGFEGAGCDNNYGQFQADLSTSTIAHTGAQSCLVCYNAGTFYC